MKKVLSMVAALAITAGAVYFALRGIIWVATNAWAKFVALDPSVAASLFTGSVTALAAIVTILIARYFERKRELAALHRETKVEFYDEFLKKWFDLVNEGGTEGAAGEGLVDYLRDLQRKIILWSGPAVLKKYAEWNEILKTTEPNAQSMFKMEEFFYALRRDLGSSNRGLHKGDILKFIMKHPHVFLQAASKNPNVTLAEVAEKEKELGLD